MYRYFINEYLLRTSRNIHFVNLTYIYIYVCIYILYNLHMYIYIYYNMLEQNMLRISQDTGISEFRCVWISHCLGSYTSSFFFGQ